MTITRRSQQALWMHNFMSEIGIAQLLLATLKIDNNLSIVLAKSIKSYLWAKHIDIRHYYIRE